MCMEFVQPPVKIAKRIMLQYTEDGWFYVAGSAALTSGAEHSEAVVIYSFTGR